MKSKAIKTLRRQGRWYAKFTLLRPRVASTIDDAAPIRARMQPPAGASAALVSAPVKSRNLVIAMADCDDLCYASAVELGDRYRRGELSPVEVTESALARLASLNPEFNMFYELDPAGALDQARSSEARWRKGEPNGPLDGVATNIKDALGATGTVSYRGSAAHAPGGTCAKSDVPAVARLREQGCVFLGKSTMPDFGIFAFRVTARNTVSRATPGTRRKTRAVRVPAPPPVLPPESTRLRSAPTLSGRSDYRRLFAASSGTSRHKGGSRFISLMLQPWSPVRWRVR